MPVEIEKSQPPVALSVFGRRIVNVAFYLAFSVALGFGAWVAWMVLSGGGAIACGRFHPQHVVEAVDLATGKNRTLTYEISYCCRHGSLWSPFSKSWSMNLGWWPAQDVGRSDTSEQYKADQAIVAVAAFDTVVLPRFGKETATELHRQRLVDHGGLLIFEARQGAAIGQFVVLVMGIGWVVGLRRVLRGDSLYTGKSKVPVS